MVAIVTHAFAKRDLWDPNVKVYLMCIFVKIFYFLYYRF